MAFLRPDGRGKKSTRLRLFNELFVLQALRRMGEASKADLARCANLTNAAVGGIINSLESQGLVHTGGKRYSTGQRGQPATMLRLNAKGAYGIGVRLDRVGMETVLIDFEGSLMARLSHETTLPSPQKTLDVVRRDVEKALEILDDEQKGRLAGIGLAMPFNLDAWLKELNLPPNEFKQWENVDFADMLEKATGISVYAENDGTAAAIAELFYGVGREIDDFMYLFFGPGIGGGLVLDGESYRGDSGNAADVGLMPTQCSKLPSAPQPDKGWDIMLNRSSLNSLIRHLEFHGMTVSTKAQLESIIRENSAPFQEWLADCVDALTPAVWTSRALLDFPVVVLGADVGGGLTARLCEALCASLAANAPEARTPPKVVTGSFGSDAGAVGAASLPIFYCFSPRTDILTSGSDN